MTNPNETTPAEIAIIPATARTFTIHQQGDIELILRVNANYREIALQLFAEPNATVALARLQDGTAIPTPSNYGRLAKILHKSAFFRSPDVWRAIGSDEEFLAWVREQRCAYCSAQPNEHRRTEAAHVRRVANGAGMGIKPEYSAIPLCHDHHAKQHAKGETALGGRNWCDKKRVEYVSRWAWETLKRQLGFISWSVIPPTKLCEWATDKGVQAYLPPEYRVNPVSPATPLSERE